MKVLWVGDQLDIGGGPGLLRGLKGFLEYRGYNFEQCDLETENPEEKIKTFRPDVVITHFGSVSRAEAAVYLRRFKNFGCKVVVYSVSRIGFEDADEVIPFIDAQKLVDLIEKLAGDKEPD